MSYEQNTSDFQSIFDSIIRYINAWKRTNKKEKEKKEVNLKLKVLTLLRNFKK